ncbi:hypothetical protein PR048_014179 [Dryococelus australis]|uniref:Uncharacterized protein n=1 Tax=Dryococelus australis TaxID=614101 RepID=A0ABQ9HDF4_9NEOP|nr:hypothetical protein PR048_014179 [Dryococelus australis]
MAKELKQCFPYTPVGFWFLEEVVVVRPGQASARKHCKRFLTGGLQSSAGPVEMASLNSISGLQKLSRTPRPDFPLSSSIRLADMHTQSCTNQDNLLILLRAFLAPGDSQKSHMIIPEKDLSYSLWNKNAKLPLSITHSVPVSKTVNMLHVNDFYDWYCTQKGLSARGFELRPSKRKLEGMLYNPTAQHAGRPPCWPPETVECCTCSYSISINHLLLPSQEFQRASGYTPNSMTVGREVQKLVFRGQAAAPKLSNTWHRRFDGKVWVWRMPGEHLSACIEPIVKFGSGLVTAWSCFSWRGFGPLVALRGTVKAQVYIGILTAFMLHTIEDLFGDDNSFFQHGRAPVHLQCTTPSHIDISSHFDALQVKGCRSLETFRHLIERTPEKVQAVINVKGWRPCVPRDETLQFRAPPARENEIRASGPAGRFETVDCEPAVSTPEVITTSPAGRFREASSLLLLAKPFNSLPQCTLTTTSKHAVTLCSYILDECLSKDDYFPRRVASNYATSFEINLGRMSLLHTSICFIGHNVRHAPVKLATTELKAVPRLTAELKALEYTTRTRVDLMQDFQKCSGYREQPLGYLRALVCWPHAIELTADTLNILSTQQRDNRELRSIQAGKGLYKSVMLFYDELYPIASSKNCSHQSRMNASHTLWDQFPIPMPSCSAFQGELVTRADARIAATRRAFPTHYPHVTCTSLRALRSKLLKEGGLGKESAMAFVKDPFQHSSGVISGNHRKPKSGWPDRETNPVHPNTRSVVYHCAALLGAVALQMRKNTQRVYKYISSMTFESALFYPIVGHSSFMDGIHDRAGALEGGSATLSALALLGLWHAKYLQTDGALKDHAYQLAAAKSRVNEVFLNALPNFLKIFVATEPTDANFSRGHSGVVVKSTRLPPKRTRFASGRGWLVENVVDIAFGRRVFSGPSRRLQKVARDWNRPTTTFHNTKVMTVTHAIMIAGVNVAALLLSLATCFRERKNYVDSDVLWHGRSFHLVSDHSSLLGARQFSTWLDQSELAKSDTECPLFAGRHLQCVTVTIIQSRSNAEMKVQGKREIPEKTRRRAKIREWPGRGLSPEATVAERLACSPPTKAIQVHHRPAQSGFSHVEIGLDDARPVFSEISHLPRPFIPALLHTYLHFTCGVHVDASFWTSTAATLISPILQHFRCERVYSGRSVKELTRSVPASTIVHMLYMKDTYDRYCTQKGTSSLYVGHRPSAHASKMVSLSSNACGEPFANQRLVTHLPAGSPPNRKSSTARCNQSSPRQVSEPLVANQRIRFSGTFTAFIFCILSICVVTPHYSEALRKLYFKDVPGRLVKTKMNYF